MNSLCYVLLITLLLTTFTKCKHVVRVHVNIPAKCTNAKDLVASINQEHKEKRRLLHSLCTSPSEAEIIQVQEECPEQRPCPCPCVPACSSKGLLLHSKVMVTSKLCDVVRTVYCTRTFLRHSTHTQTHNAVQWITEQRDAYRTSHTTVLLPVTVESVKTRFVTKPCTYTVTRTRSAVLTSTREFLCIENRPVTNTTVVIETSVVPSLGDCVTTEIETMYCWVMSNKQWVMLSWSRCGCFEFLNKRNFQLKRRGEGRSKEKREELR